MLDESAIKAAFEQPDVDDPVLLNDEVGYTVERVERNRGLYRVVLDATIKQDAALRLLEDAFGDGVFGVRTDSEQAVDDDDAMYQIVSFRYRD